MAIVVPVPLSYLCSNVVRVISLFPLVPLVATTLRASNLQGLDVSTYPRDTTQISKGFPNSLNLDVPTYDLSSANSNLLLNAYPGIVFPLPPNAYATVPGSETSLSGVQNTSVLLIDCTVCPVEPGISRLRIDYVDVNNTARTDYLDMPFWEGWDHHPSEIQQIVDYGKEAIQYIQDEIVVLQDGVFDALERAQIRGMSVSGTLGATQATNVSAPIAGQTGASPSTGHGLPGVPKTLKLNEKKSVLQPKTSNYPYTIVSVTPDQGVFAGDTVTVTIDTKPASTDAIYLGNIKLPTTINGSTFTATLPTVLTYSFSINLRIASVTGKQLSADYDLTILALPYIESIFGKSNGNVVPGSQFVISGGNFGLSQGATTFTFNSGVSAVITLWSPTKIAGIVPLDASSGFATLTTNAGKNANILVNVAGQLQTDVFAITPNIVAVLPSETLQFTATLNGSPVNPNWAISSIDGNIGTGNLGYGSIDQNGLYTAPSNVFQTFNLNVVCNYVTGYGNLYASTSVVVLSATNTLTITPALATIQCNNTQLFTLSNNNNAVSNASWYVNGLLGGNPTLGTITQSGLYQAPPVIPQNSSVFITGIANAGAGTAPAQIVSAPNVNSSVGQSHSLSKFVPIQTGPNTTNVAESCIPDVYKFLNGTIGQTLSITDWTMATNNDGAYYVTAYNQPSCGNQDGIITVSDGSTGIYGEIYFTPQSSGFYSIVAYVSGTTYYYQINVSDAATPTLTSTTSACPGSVMTIAGLNYPSDLQIRIAETNQSLQITQTPVTGSGICSVNVILPSSLSNSEGTLYHVYLYSPTVGISNELEFAIPAGCGLATVTAELEISPGQETYTSGEQIQYAATLQASDGTNTDVSSSVIWYVLSSTYDVTGYGNAVQGGNSTVGTITSNGLYTAPSTNTSNITIIGQYVYNGGPKVGYGYLSPPSSGGPTVPTYSSPPTTSSSDCAVLIITPTNQTVAVPGPGHQFTCTFTNVTQNTSAVIQPTWFVAGIEGGDSVHGTIDVNGYYTPPEYYPPQDYAQTEVGAEYTFTNSNNVTETLKNYGIIDYYQSVRQTGDCQIAVVSQINLEFGDGRVGFVPTTTQNVSLKAGYYLLATYQENLDSNFLPIPNFVPQQMFLSTISAQAQNLATVIYNQSQIYQGATPGTYTSPYTIVLGICDPTSGLFQSMWDEITVVQPDQNDIVQPPTNCDIAHSMPTLTEHIQSALIGNAPIKVLPAKFMWAAKGSYDNEKLTFENIPKLLYFDKDNNFFKAENIGTKKVFTLKPEQMLVCMEKDGFKELVVIGLNDTIPDDSRIYVLGVVLDKFQSLSPFLTVKSGFSMYEKKNQVLKLNNLLIQWGELPLDKNKVKFDVPFKSYNLNLSSGALIQNSTSKDFDYTIIDKSATNTWFAMGS